MQAWPHALQGYDRIVSTCMHLLNSKMRPYSYDLASNPGSLQEKLAMTRMNGGLLLDMHCHVETTDCIPEMLYII